MFYFLSLVKEVPGCGPGEGATSVPGIYIPSLLLLHQPQHMAPMWWDRMAAGGPVRRKRRQQQQQQGLLLSFRALPRSHTQYLHVNYSQVVHP